MQSDSQKGFILSVLSGAFVATITALISILIFASIIKVFTLGNSVVKTVSQFLKVLAIFLGCMFSLRDNKGLIKGATVGGVFTAVIYLLFKLYVIQKICCFLGCVLHFALNFQKINPFLGCVLMAVPQSLKLLR